MKTALVVICVSLLIMYFAVQPLLNAFHPLLNALSGCSTC